MAEKKGRHARQKGYRYKPRHASEEEKHSPFQRLGQKVKDAAEKKDAAKKDKAGEKQAPVSEDVKVEEAPQTEDLKVEETPKAEHPEAPAEEAEDFLKDSPIEKKEKPAPEGPIPATPVNLDMAIHQGMDDTTIDLIFDEKTLKSQDIEWPEMTRKQKIRFAWKKYRKRIVLAVVAVIAAIGIYYVYQANNFTDVSLTDNLEVTFSGKDGSGKAEVSSNKIDYTASSKTEKAFFSALDYSFSKDSKLSNGDEVTVDVVYDDALAEQLKLNITSYEKTFTVSGLKETLDLCANVSVSFSGYNGEGTATLDAGEVDYEGEDKDIAAFAKTITFSLDKDSALTDGDEVTVTASYDKDTAEKLNIIIENETKAFTVSGLRVRYNSVSDVSASDKATVENFAKSQMKAFIKNHGLKVDSESYTSIWFEKSSGDNRIMYYEVFHFTRKASESEDSTTPKDAYFTIAVTGITDTMTSSSLASDTQLLTSYGGYKNIEEYIRMIKRYYKNQGYTPAS